MEARAKVVRDSLSALGIVASLVFVGMELRQSNAWAEQEALQSVIEDWREYALATVTNRHVADITEQVVNGAVQSDFDGADRQAMHLMYLTLNKMWEFRYKQLAIGILHPEDVVFPDPAVNTWWVSNFHREVWPLNRSEFSEDFALFWEQRFGLLSQPSG